MTDRLSDLPAEVAIDVLASAVRSLPGGHDGIDQALAWTTTERPTMDTRPTSYTPDRKIAAAAIATVLVWLLQALAGIDVPAGIEGALAVIVAYLVPSTTSTPLEDDR
jgi:hypothetical protein